MKHSGVETVLNELSMLLFEEHPVDAESIKKTFSAPLKALETNLDATGNDVRISDAINDILSASDLSLDVLSRFVESVQEVLHNPEISFSFNVLGTSKHHSKDFAPSIDQDLLIEFIEKHSTGLDEFEGMLLDPAYEGTDYSEVSLNARGYIHNLKGDAGSLGINGIERVCHFIEDKIDEAGVKGMLEPLLLFKEWASIWLQTLSTGSFSGESADSFQERFIKTLNDEAGIPSLKSSDEDLSCANLDLLAELLAEEKNVVVKEKVNQYPIEGDPEVFVEFVNEAEDHLGAVEVTILDASGSYNKEMIDTIFRGVHSIKGASSYFKLLEVTETSHQTESLMDEVRSGKREFDQGLADLILTYVDLQRRLIAKAKEAAASNSLITRMDDSEIYLQDLEVYAKGSNQQSKETSNTKSSGDVPSKNSELSQKDEGAKGDKLEIKNYVKVETDRLDHLIDAIGEMAIYSSMLIDNVRRHQATDEHLIKVTHQVEKFSRELQQIGMGMRLIPIRGLFQKMSRLVWDVARKIGKEVKFSMEGEDTELDRTIIEKLADPLMHMIRNAIDHGVEGPEDRVKVGKDRAGVIELRAFHSGGNIHVQIIDDGRGLNPEKLMAKAREKGILGENERLSDKDAFHLIFAAGFSTAAQVTDISGRGVGMDVVRRNIESMRGRVHIDSVLGQGTTFTIELPLTLAIIDGISVGVGTETFVIPTLSVVEFMQPKEDQITRALDKGETFYFRGKYLPLYRLGNLFNVEPKRRALTESLVVVVENAGQHFALLVDEISSTHSTVIKSVGEMFTTNRGIAGCAIMPNGDIALILDLRSLLEMAKDTYSYNQVYSQRELSRDAH